MLQPALGPIDYGFSFSFIKAHAVLLGHDPLAERSKFTWNNHNESTDERDVWCLIIIINTDYMYMYIVEYSQVMYI